MGIFTKKPVDIEALPFDGSQTSAIGIVAWANANDFDGIMSRPYEVTGPDGPTFALEVTTLEGVMLAKPGDWIIKGVQGEFYPCKPDIFEATYIPKDTTGEATA
jgi:hypothetical protein